MRQAEPDWVSSFPCILLWCWWCHYLPLGPACAHASFCLQPHNWCLHPGSATLVAPPWQLQLHLRWVPDYRSHCRSCTAGCCDAAPAPSNCPPPLSSSFLISPPLSSSLLLSPPPLHCLQVSSPLKVPPPPAPPAVLFLLGRAIIRADASFDSSLDKHLQNVVRV